MRLFLPSKEQILSMNYDENPYTDTDTVLYPLKQIITLLCSANPNTIEILGTRNEDRNPWLLSSSIYN